MPPPRPLRLAAVAATALSVALAGPARAEDAPDAGDLARELEALRARVEELEKAHEAAAQPPPAASALDGVKIGGWLDPVYSYNADLRQGQFQFLTPIAAVGYGYASSYTGTVSLDFRKETENGTRVRLTLMPARSSSDVVEALGGIVHEASFSIPLAGPGLRLIGGQLPDWSGYESLAPTQNRLVTHNLLFDFTIPTFYTGAGLERSGGAWTVKAMIANQSSSHRHAFEWTPVLTYRVEYAGGERWGLGLAGVNGKARNFQPQATRDTRVDLLEVDGTCTVGAFELQAPLGAGHQREASIIPDPATGRLRDAMWLGASALVAYEVTDALEAVLRADVILDHWNGGGLLAYSVPDDRNGIGPSGYSIEPDTLDDGTTPNPSKRGDPSKGADRWAITAGARYTFTENAAVKAEYRLDGATQPVFRSNAATDPTQVRYSRTNQLVSASLVVSF